VVDVSLGDHYDVFANVIIVMVLFDHLPADRLHIRDIAQDRQADLLVAEDTPMGDLDSGFERLGLSGLEQFSVDGTSFVLYILLTVEGVGEHVADYLDGPIDVLAEDSHHIRCIFPRGIGIQVSTDVLDLQLQIVSCADLGALEMQVLQEMSNTTGLLGLVPASALDED
jgi:hypothetical protein